MAKGFQKNKEHKEKVAMLGKTLIRRAEKKCELCQVQGESMAVMEGEPAPAVPDPDHAVMICNACAEVLAQEKPNPDQARFLESAVWSEIPAVQVTAVRLCRKLADTGTDWAVELLDAVYLSPEAEEWLKQ